MVPKAALIAYAYDSGPYNSHDKYHLELRPITPDGRMGAAVPVSHEFIGALADNYSAVVCRIPYGRVPPNLLECNSRKGYEKYVWYNPPGKHRMFFTENLNIADGEFHLPGVVYKVEKEKLDIAGRSAGPDLCRIIGILGETLLDKRVLSLGRPV